MTVYGTWCTLRIPDDYEDDGYKLVVAISTTFLGFTNQLSLDRMAVEVRPLFMSNPTQEPSDWLQFMFRESILYIDTNNDELQLRYSNGPISERVEIGNKIIYYMDNDTPKTLHISKETYEKMLVTELEGFQG